MPLTGGKVTFNSMLFAVVRTSLGIGCGGVLIVAYNKIMWITMIICTQMYRLGNLILIIIQAALIVYSDVIAV